jgi:hypothetical protein
VHFIHLLNCGTIYLFKFLALVKVVRHIDGVGHKDKTFKDSMFLNSFRLQYNKAYFPYYLEEGIIDFAITQIH